MGLRALGDESHRSRRYYLVEPANIQFVEVHVHLESSDDWMSVCRPNSSSRPGEAPRLPAGNVGMRTGCVRRDISRFFPRIDRIFFREALNPFFGAQDQGFSKFRST